MQRISLVEFDSAEAANHRLDGATSEWVGFLRAGEQVDPELLERVERFLAALRMPEDLSDAAHFTTVPKAFLTLLREAHGTQSRAPRWLQSMVAFRLFRLFAWADRPAGAMSAATGEVADAFHDVLAQLCRELEPEVIGAFTGRRFPEVWRDYLAHAYAGAPWHSARVTLGRQDHDQKLVRVEYRFTGTLPREEFLVDGRPVEPVYAKVRALPYFDRELLHHRLAWVPEGELEVRLGGVAVDVHRPKARRREPPPTSRQDRLMRRLARSAPVRRRFARAWVLMDRTHDADDSGEHLFCYLRASQPGTNAWFVIEKDTPDYRRLRADFRRRVVAYGSVRWKLLMANAEHLISSHADAAIVRPAELRAVMPEPRRRFTFLNHGVIKDDLSGWLNAQDIEIFVTSTTGEYESVCGDGTAYLHTRKEAQLTGMPRFDRVREAGSRFPPAERDLILIAPTWRSWLVAQAAPGSQRRVLVPGFAETDFARQWRAVLRSEELAELAQRTGLQVATLLHPNLAAVSDELDLPAHVTSFGFEGTEVRELFARARVLVTDYSSMAFNAAYIDRPVVYFQFDHAEMFGGAHVGRRGYFDYARDGYGPVTFDPASAVGAVREIVERGPDPAEEYRRRIAEAFPQRDGRCSERVYAAIRASVESPGQSGKVSTGASRVRPA